MHRSGWILLGFAAATAAAAEPPREIDVTKVRIVERPIEELVAKSAPAEAAAAEPAASPKPVDRTKGLVIERPVEEIVRELSLVGDEIAGIGAPAADRDNPPAEPGKVKWHRDVTAALAAARTSGKPVLVFHLLGQLDQRFT
jgi:hypothetical protein